MLLGTGCVHSAVSRSRASSDHRESSRSTSVASPVPKDAPEQERGFLGEGMASFYGPGLYGHRTANGERLTPGTLTAAHRTLRFGTCVRVVNMGNQRSVQVRINDRGPFVRARILDVSEEAARQLGIVGRGVARVRLYQC